MNVIPLVVVVIILLLFIIYQIIKKLYNSVGTYNSKNIEEGIDTFCDIYKDVYDLEYFLDLLETEEVKYEKRTDTTPNDNITTIITTNYSNCASGIEIMSQTLDSLKLVPLLLENKIIICFDGGPMSDNSVHEKCSKVLSDEEIIRYNIYKTCVKIYALRNLKHVIFKELETRGCLTKNIYQAFSEVQTKYVNIMQYDLHIIKGFDLKNVLDAMDENEDKIDTVRYCLYTNKVAEITNITRSIYRECKNLFTGIKINNIFHLETLRTEKVNFSHDSEWSDNNHIAKTTHYVNDVFPETLHENSFMEHKIKYYPRIKDKKMNYKTWFLGDYSDGIYVKHIDGRHCNDAKINNHSNLNFYRNFLSQVSHISQNGKYDDYDKNLSCAKL